MIDPNNSPQSRKDDERGASQVISETPEAQQARHQLQEPSEHNQVNTCTGQTSGNAYTKNFTDIQIMKKYQHGSFFSMY